MEALQSPLLGPAAPAGKPPVKPRDKSLLEQSRAALFSWGWNRCASAWPPPDGLCLGAVAAVPLCRPDAPPGPGVGRAAPRTFPPLDIPYNVSARAATVSWVALTTQRRCRRGGSASPSAYGSSRSQRALGSRQPWTQRAGCGHGVRWKLLAIARCRGECLRGATNRSAIHHDVVACLTWHAGAGADGQLGHGELLSSPTPLVIEVENRYAFW